MHNTAFSGDSNQRIIKEQYSFPISLLNKDSRVSGRNGKMSIYFTHPCLSTNGKMAAGRSRMNEQENITWSRPSDIRADGEADILCLAQTSPCDEVNNVLSKTCLSLSDSPGLSTQLHLPTKKAHLDSGAILLSSRIQFLFPLLFKRCSCG